MRCRSWISMVLSVGLTGPLLATASGPAGAQSVVENCFDCVIGLYDDIQMTSTCGTIQPGVPKDIYLGVRFAGADSALAGIELSIAGARHDTDGIILIHECPTPACPPVIGSLEAPADTSASSSGLGGMNFAWPSCQRGSQALLHLVLVSFAPVPSDKALQVKRS